MKGTEFSQASGQIRWWKTNKPSFKNNLQCPDDQDRAGSQNVDLFTFQAP